MTQATKPPAVPAATAPLAEPKNPGKPKVKPVEEIDGPKGLEPTRYGDWERKGICVDF
jgi:hypothetical protein